MKISVIIPLFNKEHHIERAITSILTQSFQDFEIIIVDDGSTDSSFSTASSIRDHRIRIIQQQNQGVSAARNRGVSEAQSDWVAFLDADDEWLPDFLMGLVNLRSSYPDEDFFCTSYFFQDSYGQRHSPKTDRLFATDQAYLIDNFLRILRIGLPFNSSTFSITKKAFQESGGFAVGVSYQEDVDYWIRLSLCHKIAFLNTPLAIYHQDSENRACDKYDSIIGESFVVNNLVQLMGNDQIPNQLKQSAIEYVAKYQIPLAKHHLLQNESNKAKEVLQTCAGTRVYFWSWLFTSICTFIPSPIFRQLLNLKNSFKG